MTDARIPENPPQIHPLRRLYSVPSAHLVPSVHSVAMVHPRHWDQPLHSRRHRHPDRPRRRHGRHRRPGGAPLHAATAPPPHAATPHRVLFDNAHAETAGNADWIICTSQPDPLGQDSSPSAETDWTGALSSWGVALQKTGDYSLKTLPSGSTITYGGSAAHRPVELRHLRAARAQHAVHHRREDRHHDVRAERRRAVHDLRPHRRDRNNDGEDAVEILNDLMTNNSVDSTDPFGFSIDSLEHQLRTTRAPISDSTNPVLHGSFGTVTRSLIANGTTVTLKPADNSAVKGLLYRTGYSGNTGAFFATSTFGSGRVAFWGDSSPIDDGTGQSGNTLYDGWNDTGATNAALALNATEWLAGDGSSGGGGDGGGGPAPAPPPSCSATPASSPAAPPGPPPAA